MEQVSEQLGLHSDTLFQNKTQEEEAKTKGTHLQKWSLLCIGQLLLGMGPVLVTHGVR